MQEKSEENKQRLNNYQSVGAVLGNGYIIAQKSNV
jgi:hypothetical protein